MYVVATPQVHDLPAHAPQSHYPTLMFVMRFCYLVKRTYDHVRTMDATVMSGHVAVIAWKLGLVKLWQKTVLRHYIAKRKRVERPPPVPRTRQAGPSTDTEVPESAAS